MIYCLLIFFDKLGVTFHVLFALIIFIVTFHSDYLKLTIVCANLILRFFAILIKSLNLILVNIKLIVLLIVITVNLLLVSHVRWRPGLPPLSRRLLLPYNKAF